MVFVGRYWHNESNRRKVFDDIAASRGFDPLIPSYWYTFSTEDIQNEKVLTSPSHYY